MDRINSKVINKVELDSLDLIFPSKNYQKNNHINTEVRNLTATRIVVILSRKVQLRQVNIELSKILSSEKDLVILKSYQISDSKHNHM